MMTSQQRIATALGHQEPDRVPLLMSVTMHGARELGLSIKEYFASAETVALGQIRMRERYGHDVLLGCYHAPLEFEAFGGEVLYREDGPPNAGEPIISSGRDILRLTAPVIEETRCLDKVLKALGQLRRESREEVPVIGVVISPFSLPVMQLGFGHYLEIMYEEPALFERLMQINEEFCVNWANAQLAAGATAIAYVDPVASPQIVPQELYRKLALPLARRVIAHINGAVATSFASAPCLALADDIAESGTVAVAVGSQEDLGSLKAAFCNKVAVIGNLDGIRMRSWNAAQAEQEVKRAIAAAGPGGGFVLSDSHGEIPWQVPEETLSAIASAARKWGNYPLEWLHEQ